MASRPRFALTRAGIGLLVLALTGCSAGGQPTASTEPSPTIESPTAPSGASASPVAPSPAAPSPAPRTGPPASLASAEPSPSAAVTAGPAGPAWQYLSDFPSEGAIEVASVTVTPDGFVAVGYQPVAGDRYYGLRQGVVWRSPDGRTWERLVPPEFEQAALHDVVYMGDQLYAVGQVSACKFIIDDGCTDRADAGWTVWRSSDGASWARLPQTPSMQTAPVIDGVVAGPGLLVVHGGAGDDLAAAVWSSADGETWHETRELGGLDPISAMASGPGGYVAFGTRFDASQDYVVALAAHSADARSFQPVQLPSSMPVNIESVDAGDTGYVAVGYADPDEQPLTATSLASADGQGWLLAPAQDAFVNMGFQHVSAVPGGYVAIGFVPEPLSFDLQAGTIWFSADGLTWTARGSLQGAAYQELGGVAVSDSGMVVFAANAEEEGDEDVIITIHGWFAPIDRLTSP